MLRPWAFIWLITTYGTQFEGNLFRVGQLAMQLTKAVSPKKQVQLEIPNGNDFCQLCLKPDSSQANVVYHGICLESGDRDI